MHISPGFVAIFLYINPTNNRWAPLIYSRNQVPVYQFLAIINPYNGPNGNCPTAEYVTGLASLNAHKNIQTLGYVYTDYGNRALSGTNSSENDVASYNHRASCSTTQDPHSDGIWFDELPTTTELDGVHLSHGHKWLVLLQSLCWNELSFTQVFNR